MEAKDHLTHRTKDLTWDITPDGVLLVNRRSLSWWERLRGVALPANVSILDEGLNEIQKFSVQAFFSQHPEFVDGPMPGSPFRLEKVASSDDPVE